MGGAGFDAFVEKIRQIIEAMIDIAFGAAAIDDQDAVRLLVCRHKNFGGLMTEAFVSLRW